MFGLTGCEVDLYEFRETREPACEKAGVSRACLCPDDTWGEAACYGADDSAPCDCVGAAPGGGVLDVAVGGAHACAVLRDGRVACWGENRHGQLGAGTRDSRTVPAEVLDLGGAVAIALGGGTISGHSCALLEDGRARCWGLDDQGQLGDGKLQPRERPVEVPLEDLRVLEAGTSHTCAADKVGRLSCWGRATAFADEPVLSASGVVVPTPIAEVDGVVGLGLGDLHTCAVTGEGDVFCWGEGGEGRLGHGSTSREETPRAVTGLPEVRQVVAGRAHACALAIDGSTWCWGANDHGQLGTREPAMHARPQRLHDLPGSTSLATGWQHTCALGVDGRARCWGANDAGQLGDGTFEPRAGVHTVEDLEGVLQIAAKVRTNCARLRDGRLHCWGDNRAGQLGDGTDHDRHTPTPVRWQLGDVDDGSDAGLD